MRLVLHVHYRPFSVTSKGSLRDSEPPLNEYPSTKGQETSQSRSKCVKLVLLCIHTKATPIEFYVARALPTPYQQCSI